VQEYETLPDEARTAGVACAAVLARGCQPTAAQALGVIARDRTFDAVLPKLDAAALQRRLALPAAVLAALHTSASGKGYALRWLSFQASPKSYGRMHSARRLSA